MSEPHATRPCAFVLLRAGDRFLVSEMTDRDDGRVYYRPPGGGVEFGERAAAAATRELREEFGLDIDEPRLLGVVENIFEQHNGPHHEICFVFVAETTDEVLDRLDGTDVLDLSDGERETARVFRVDALLERARPLYPDGLAELLPDEMAASPAGRSGRDAASSRDS
jgi:ADP-ribose pyrophosphatase YjhB (NUDIX family)